MRIAHIVDSNGRQSYAEEVAPGRFEWLEGSTLGSLARTGKAAVPARWLPIIDPRAMLCIGRNYAGHARERGEEIPSEPVVFMKNPSTVTGHLEPIMIPSVCEDEVDYEGELAVVLGQDVKNISQTDALSAVWGYTIANDVSARVWQSQRGGGQWCRAKSFDTFAPLGPVLVTPDELGDPQNLQITTEVSGEVLQDCSTQQMLFSVAELIAFLSQDTTLLAGTVLLTGTPEGVGWSRTPRRTLKSVDVVRVTISGIGVLENPVQ